TCQNASGRTERLVGQDGKGGTTGRQRRNGLRHSLVRPRVRKQLRVVDFKKSRKGVRGCDARCGACTGDQLRRTLTDHSSDRRRVERRGAGGDEQLVGRIGEIAERVDERAVEVEDKQADHSAYSANEVGVSQSLTRTTGSPSLAACW